MEINCVEMATDTLDSIPSLFGDCSITISMLFSLMSVIFHFNCRTMVDHFVSVLDSSSGFWTHQRNFSTEARSTASSRVRALQMNLKRLKIILFVPFANLDLSRWVGELESFDAQAVRFQRRGYLKPYRTLLSIPEVCIGCFTWLGFPWLTNAGNVCLSPLA